MKLSTALATARQQINPEFKGTKFPDSGIYRANNGQFMTGTRDSAPYKNASMRWTCQEFVDYFGAAHGSR